MKLLTRVKLYGLLATLVVASGLIAYSDEWGRPNPQLDTTDPVTVHAQWFRSRTANPIQVKVYAEGQQIWDEPLTVSPWSKTFLVPRGALVVARFDQPTGGKLQCRVDRPTRIGATKSIEHAGQLLCEG